ncbi:MAG: hypothetical protein Q4D93_00740 [Porphyromonas sp.]|nr:hypothetical protein [Porphyromonas sp.]
MTEQSHEDNERVQMLEMRLGALGNISEKPSLMVVILIPKTPELHDAGDFVDDLSIFFPVPVPSHLGQTFYWSLQRLAKSGRQEVSLTDCYLKALGIQVIRLEITEYGQGFLTSIRYADKDGREIQAAMRLHTAVYYALMERVPIYIEERVLLKIARGIKLNLVNERGDTHSSAVPDMLSFHIKRGDKPEDLTDDFTKELLSDLDSERRAELTQLAIEHESYEWAQLLKELEDKKEEDDGGSKNGE